MLSFCGDCREFKEKVAVMEVNDVFFSNCNDIMPFLQIYNEMYLQTTAALSSAPPLLSETIPMFHAEASNVSHTRPQNKSNSTSVSSPHSDPENRSVNKMQEYFHLLSPFACAVFLN